MLAVTSFVWDYIYVHTAQYREDVYSMVSYPKHFPPAAVAVAEELVRDVVAERLEKSGWIWRSVPHDYIISAYELAAVKAPMSGRLGAVNSTVSLVGMVFSKCLPLLHHEFVSDGFRLEPGGTADKPVIVVRQQPPCVRGYGYNGDWGPRSAEAAARNAVRGLIDWRLARHRESFSPGKLPNGPEGFGHPLVESDVYSMIRKLARFTFPRVRDIIEFIEESVPDLRDEWIAAGYKLTPFYIVDRRGRAIELRLISTSDDVV